jgi:ArsR family transcriptional regulator, arsenate/arsenite/antimonite-responsive transcriptional repressor
MQLADGDEDRLAAMLRALSHPVRLEMVRTLADRGDRQCIDLTPEVSVAQSTVSEHRKVLKDAGLIQQCGPGPGAGYCVNKEALRWLKQSVVAL